MTIRKQSKAMQYVGILENFGSVERHKEEKTKALMSLPLKRTFGE
jgi:hypothetical protein